MKSKRVALVNAGRCVSCGTCMKVCPKGAISVWKGCYASVNEDGCVGCGRCERVCPSGCISMKERKTI